MAFVIYQIARQSGNPYDNPSDILNTGKPTFIGRQVTAFKIRYPLSCQDRIHENVTRL